MTTSLQCLSIGDRNASSDSSNNGRGRPLHFLDLPTDVHRLVLGDLLLKDTPIRLETTLGLVDSVEGLSSAILQVNRYLYHEGCSVLYGLNVFEVEAGLFLDVPRHLVPYIRTILKLRYKVFSDGWLLFCRHKLERCTPTAQRWLDSEGGRSIQQLGHHTVGLHSLEIDVSSPFPSPTGSSNIVRELRNLQLPVLHSLNIIGIDDEDLVRSIQEDLKAKNSRQQIPHPPVSHRVLPQLVSRISSSAASLKALATSFQIPSIMKAQLHRILPKHNLPSPEQQPSFRAQPPTRPPSEEEQLLLVIRQIELQQKEVVLQWQKLEAEKKLMRLRSSSNEHNGLHLTNTTRRGSGLHLKNQTRGGSGVTELQELSPTVRFGGSVYEVGW